MKNVIKRKSEGGFSLVELMIVVGIIGVLATLALPRFKQFQAKAKMGEAKNILSHVYTLEQTYALDNNTFINVGNLGSHNATSQCTPDSGAQQIGFRIDPCNDKVPRFGYRVEGATASQFTARAWTGADNANKVCPGNPAFNISLNQNNEIADVNVGSVCSN